MSSRFFVRNVPRSIPRSLKHTGRFRGYYISVNLILASASPRRKELLHVLGIPFTVVPASIDETPGSEEEPQSFAARVAREKGREVASRISQAVVLSADTVVTIDGEIL